MTEASGRSNIFNFVNKKMSRKRGIGALRNNQGEIITSDKQRADLLNDHFGSVCTVDDGNIPPFDHVVPDTVSLDVINFTPEKVIAAIKKLKPNKSSGPDGLPPLLFKKTASSLAEPLSIIYNSFMSVGVIPRNWAHAVVTPLYKNGVSNYRPISLTCVAEW